MPVRYFVITPIDLKILVMGEMRRVLSLPRSTLVLNKALRLISNLMFRPHLWILHEEPVTLGSRQGRAGGSHPREKQGRSRIGERGQGAWRKARSRPTTHTSSSSVPQRLLGHRNRFKPIQGAPCLSANKHGKHTHQTQPSVAQQHDTE